MMTALAAILIAALAVASSHMSTREV